jgi:hypothetical protein
MKYKVMKLMCFYNLTTWVVMKSKYFEAVLYIFRSKVEQIL